MQSWPCATRESARLDSDATRVAKEGGRHDAGDCWDNRLCVIVFVTGRRALRCVCLMDCCQGCQKQQAASRSHTICSKAGSQKMDKRCKLSLNNCKSLLYLKKVCRDVDCLSPCASHALQLTGEL